MTKIKGLKTLKNGTKITLSNEGRELEVFVANEPNDFKGFTICEFETYDAYGEDLPLWVVVSGTQERASSIRRALMFLKKNGIPYGFLTEEERFGDEKEPEWEHIADHWVRIRSWTQVKELDFDSFFTGKWARFVWVYAHEGSVFIYEEQKGAYDHLRHDVEKELGTSWENYLPNVAPDEKMTPDSVELRGQTWEVWREVIR